ncbi:MAG TPA: SRPBCC family protein [Candidatus Kapabacteria bacterium]|nr:SRPBCC family protein [Candidatus Kapabacteria bacterium]
MGHTKNTIFIDEAIDKVFDITNRIESWKDLFTEYSESTVLKKEGNKITFRLATHPNKNGHFHRWISERIIDNDNYRCQARRLEPTYPFEYMNITWEYKQVGTGTEMIWIQDFKPCSDCTWTTAQFEEFINTNSVQQMRVIKEKIENKSVI